MDLHPDEMKSSQNSQKTQLQKWEEIWTDTSPKTYTDSKWMKRCFTHLSLGRPQSNLQCASLQNGQDQNPDGSKLVRMRSPWTLHSWWGGEPPQFATAWQTGWTVLQSQHVLTVGTSDPAPRGSIKRNENLCSHKACPWMFTAAFFHDLPLLETNPKVPQLGPGENKCGLAMCEHCSAAGVSTRPECASTLSAKC